MKLFSRPNRAFTLVELLVVIAVLGLLASTVTSSTNSARSKARDALRLSHMRETAKALDMYYDLYGSYPYSVAMNNEWVPDAWKVMVEKLVAAGLIHATFSFGNQEENTDNVSLLAFLKSLIIKDVHAVILPVGPFRPSSLQDPFYKAQDDYLWSYGYSSGSGTPLAGSQSYKIRIRLENLNHPVFGSSVSGTFIGSISTTGNYACDASLGYYCISRGM